MNTAVIIAIIEGIKAVIGFLTVIFGRNKVIEENKISQNVEFKKESDELKEAMHEAFLSQDNTAIVLCLNRYGQLRKKIAQSGN